MARDSRDNRRGSGRKGSDKKLTKTLVVGPFRMAFPALLEPEETDNGDRYKLTALFPPSYKGIREIQDAMYEVMEAEFGPEEDWPSGRNDVLPEDKLYDAGKKDYQGFKKGWWAMSMSSVDQPGVIDADKNEVMSKREIYGGRWARAQISITTYNNKSKGVGVYLNHVQLLEHDEAFSGRGSAEDAFDKYEMDDRKGKSRRDDDDEDDRKDRGKGRDRDRDERRGDRDNNRRSRGRDDEEDDRGRNSRGGDRRRASRDDDDNGRDTGRDRRGSTRARDEDDEDEAPRRGSRDRDNEDRGRRRGRDDDEDETDSRSSRGGRDADRGKSSRNSSRDEEDDDDKGSRRSSSRRSRDDDEWN